jgi:hypothetical protein
MSHPLCTLLFMNTDKRFSSESEVSGYLELGMISDAEQLARRYLSEVEPSAARFGEAMDVVLVSKSSSEWRRLVEAAFQRMTRRDREAVRFKMLCFYWSLQDFTTAVTFVSSRRCCLPEELLVALEVVLRLNRMGEARALAQKCERMLKANVSEFDQGLLHDALGSFYSRVGQPLRAMQHWQCVPTSSPSLRTALVSLVEVCLWPALNAIQQGLEIVDQKKRDPDLSAEIQQPGLEKALTTDIERDLLRLKRALEKIVPPSRQRELGISAPQTTIKDRVVFVESIHTRQ